MMTPTMLQIDRHFQGLRFGALKMDFHRRYPFGGMNCRSAYRLQRESWPNGAGFYAEVRTNCWCRACIIKRVEQANARAVVDRRGDNRRQLAPGWVCPPDGVCVAECLYSNWAAMTALSKRGC